MCKTYNTIGSLTTLKTKLAQSAIYDFKSTKDVIDFKSSFSSIRNELVSRHEFIIEQEKSTLVDELQLTSIEMENKKLETERILNEEIEQLKERLKQLSVYSHKNIFQKITRSFAKRRCEMKLRRKERDFDSSLNESLSFLLETFQNKQNRYQYITANFKDAVTQSAQHQLSELERKKSVVDDLKSFIYGALGEQKVVKTLEALSDDFHLINDFNISFSRAIYNKQENEYIKSVQIDHILVGPAGVFLIETKNWSDKSVESLSLRSPVQQIKRANFALYKLLNSGIANFHIHLDKHHWGDKKIPIKSLIVMINSRPGEEFQYVKVLTLNELLGYINYFKPIFSNYETHRIADYLLKINCQKH